MLAEWIDVWRAYRSSREVFDPRGVDLGRDRRIFHRVPVKVACELANPMFGLETAGSTINISLDGLGLTAPVNWSEGNRIRIQFKSLQLDLDGIIVFRKEEAPLFRYGVRFQKTGIFQILSLRRFLKIHHHGPLSL